MQTGDRLETDSDAETKELIVLRHRQSIGRGCLESDDSLAGHHLNLIRLELTSQRVGL